MKAAATLAKGSRPSRLSLSEQAYCLIRDSILRGQARPGTVLSRRKLAEELGMSFLPISEALQRLENDGLVESRPRAGTRVRIPAFDEVRGRYVVREALEAQSARLCCERATFQQRLELRRMAEQLDTLYDRAESSPQDPDFQFIVHTHHMALHMRIAEYSGAPQLREAIEKNHVLVYNWFYDVATERTSLPRHFHSGLIDIVTGDDILAADETMRKHVQHGLTDILAKIAPMPAGEWRARR